ncbi:MAG: tetratricopeptide repeat protein [Oscillatoria sp. PMC 1051.18]|nr:tetratricopeptide repeat protein [Oscillatoria sp. PMC 1050.18]MEC5032502.1 tetratricopeptide repeat protein [Oscillatoria sp. PMC 1051.18]
MGNSLIVDNSNFQAEVLEKSYEKPVIVDFYATWCGPCQILGPILSKLVQEYDFVLAKVDIDKNQELASRFQVEGVPDVRVAKKGEIFPGFVGALSEKDLREFLANLGLKSDLEMSLAAAQNAITGGDVKLAKKLFDELFVKYPDNKLVAIEAAKFLVKCNQLEAAKKILATVGEDEREFYSQAQSVLTLVEFKEAILNPGESELDRKYAQAAKLTLAEDYERALQLFLEIVETSRKYRDDGARKAMLAVFKLLGENDSLTQKYQQELMMTLY